MDTSNRLLSVHIMEILNEYSSKDHTMSQAELMDKLVYKYGENISRHTCSDYLSELRDNGYISGKRGVYRNDLFTERELRTLIDGVMYGKHIPEKEANELIKKLKTLSLNTMKNKANNLTYLPGINRTRNDSLYDILDKIDEAIDNNKKICITQYSPRPDGTKVSRSKRTVDPYYVVSDQSRYYLLCNANRDGNYALEPRRIDRIEKIEIVNEKRTPMIDVVGHNFELGKYMREHIYMFSGEVGAVELKISNNHIGDFDDWYGKDYRIYSTDDKYSVIRVYTNYDAVYYWALQYGSIAEVLEPESLRNKVKKGLTDILNKYK